jgi:hypothetical protein
MFKSFSAASNSLIAIDQSGQPLTKKKVLLADNRVAPNGRET